MRHTFQTILAAVIEEANHGSLVETHLAVTDIMLLGECRARVLSDLRAVLAMACLRHVPGCSNGQLGRQMHKDTASVRYLVMDYTRHHALRLALLLAAVEARMQQQQEQTRVSTLSHLHTEEGVPFQ